MGAAGRSSDSSEKLGRLRGRGDACAGPERGLPISVGSRVGEEHASLPGCAVSYRAASTGFYHFNDVRLCVCVCVCDLIGVNGAGAALFCISLNACFPLRLALRTTIPKGMYEPREVLLYYLKIVE